MNSIGIVILEDLQTEIEILVIRTFKRTSKLLYSINRGIPIINSKWLEDCLNKKLVLNYNDYQFVDDFIEKKHDFSLQESLKRAVEKSPRGIFFGYYFWISGNIENTLGDLKIIILSGEGKLLENKPKEKEGNVYEIVSIEEKNQKIDCDGTLKHCSSEDIIISALKQSTEYIGRMLFKDHEK